ncbi:MAG: glycosyltransferase family 2 protein [Deltaproteobacteria bacterium]|nr:glycosyltransferase family 2 protein [Deltaproteobacteria bacterium]
MQLLSLVIPAYNEETRIYKTLCECSQILNGKMNYEIIVVDDGSTDGTLPMVQRLSQQIDFLKVVALGKNYGKGRAVREGIRTASGDIVVFLDSDGATNFTAIFDILDALKNYDCAIGSRYLKASKARISLLRRLISRIFNVFVSILFGLKIQDTQCGFKGFRASTIKTVLDELTIDRFAFDVELLWRLSRKGCSIVEIPIEWEEKAGSKVSIIKHGFSMVKDLLLLRAREFYKRRME